MVLVPCGQVIGVDEILVVFFARLFRVVVIAIRGFCRAADDYFAHFHAVSGSQFIRLGLAVFEYFHHSYIVVDAGCTCCTCVFRKVKRTQERVPESLSGPVSVEYVVCQHFLVSYAGCFLQRAAHGHNAPERTYVLRVAFLCVSEVFQHGRYSDQEGNVVFPDIFQCFLCIELAHDYHAAAGVQSRARSCAVESSSVEPRRGVHRDVPVAHREMNHHVVAGENFIDAGERNCFLSAGRS